MGQDKSFAIIFFLLLLIPSITLGQREGRFDSVKYRQGSNYVELKASGSLATDWTLTLPVNDGNSGDYLQTDGNGVSSWQPVSGATTSVANKTGAYTALTSDDVLTADASGGAFTITLYTCSGNSGKKLIIKKTDSSYNIVTVDGNGSETIDGDLNKKLTWTQEFIEIVCDGTDWHVVARSWDKQAYSFSASWNGRSTLTFADDDAWLEKISVDTVRIRWFWSVSGGSGAAANLQISIPNSWTVDTNKVSQINSLVHKVGTYFWYDNSGSSTQVGDNHGPCLVAGSSLLGFRYPWDSNGMLGNIFANADRFAGWCDVPISQWSE
jgi:hypothetical protein